MGDYTFHAPPTIATLGGRRQVVGVTPPQPVSRFEELEAEFTAQITGRLIKRYVVPSKSSKGMRTVTVEGDWFYCNCPARVECWHIRAIRRYTMSMIQEAKQTREILKNLALMVHPELQDILRDRKSVV